MRLPTPKRVNNPVVLVARLHLTGCLDLLDIEAAKSIARWYPGLKADYRRAGLRLPRNKGGRRLLDRTLINYAVGKLEKAGKRVNTVRAAFKEGNPIVPGSQLYNRAHVQIVVRPFRMGVIKRVWLHVFSEVEGGSNGHQ